MIRLSFLVFPSKIQLPLLGFQNQAALLFPPLQQAAFPQSLFRSGCPSSFPFRNQAALLLLP